MDFVLKKTHKITGEIGYGIFPLKSYSYVKGQYFNHIYASAHKKNIGKEKSVWNEFCSTKPTADRIFTILAEGGINT